MTDATREGAKMQGDPRFHEHRGINAAVADQWKAEFSEEMLAGFTRRLAAELGYEMTPEAEPVPAPPVAPAVPALQPMLRRRGARPGPGSAVDQMAGADVDALLGQMLAERKRGG